MTALELAEHLLTYIIFSKGDMTGGRCRELIREIFGKEIDEQLAKKFSSDKPKETNLQFNCPPLCEKCHYCHHHNEPCPERPKPNPVVWGFDFGGLNPGKPIKFNCERCHDSGVVPDGMYYIREGIGPQCDDIPCPDCKGKKK